jgi:hypothetical protein
MDPVMLIVTVLAAGAPLGLKDSASAAVNDVYGALKGLVKKQLVGRPDDELALARNGQALATRQASLEAELAAAGAGIGADLVAAAHALSGLGHRDARRSRTQMGKQWAS